MLLKLRLLSQTARIIKLHIPMARAARTRQTIKIPMTNREAQTTRVARTTPTSPHRIILAAPINLTTGIRITRVVQVISPAIQIIPRLRTPRAVAPDQEAAQDQGAAPGGRADLGVLTSQRFHRECVSGRSRDEDESLGSVGEEFTPFCVTGSISQE